MINNQLLKILSQDMKIRILVREVKGNKERYTILSKKGL